MRHYFKLDEGRDISNYIFRKDSYGNELKPQKSGDKYYVEVDAPYLCNLGEAYLYISTGNTYYDDNNNNNVVFTYSILNYMAKAYKHGKDDKLLNLLNATYVFENEKNGAKPLV